MAVFIRKNSLLLFCILVLFGACDNARIFDTSISLPDKKWNKNRILTFSVAIRDTISPCDVLINLRHTSKYPFMNIIFFVSVKGPTGQELKDTANFDIAENSGKWIGRGLGDVYACRLMFLQKVKFPHSGLYTFEIQQGMRMDDLPGIMNAGIRIQKTVK